VRIAPGLLAPFDLFLGRSSAGGRQFLPGAVSAHKAEGKIAGLAGRARLLGGQPEDFVADYEIRLILRFTRAIELGPLLELRLLPR
jgi:hypothetical protein